jgi:membrane protease YdiL (CAAX protease family)
MIMPGTSPFTLLKGKKVLETTFMMYLSLIPLQLMIWGYGWILGDAGFKAPTNPFMYFDNGIDLLVLLATIVILAPLIEEIFFRGYLFKLFQDKLGDNPAIFLTAILFSAAHFNIYSFPPILIMGGLMGWARKRSGSIIPSLVLHMVNNMTALLVVWFS